MTQLLFLPRDEMHRTRRAIQYQPCLPVVTLPENQQPPITHDDRPSAYFPCLLSPK